jgi:FxsC-like protein
MMDWLGQSSDREMMMEYEFFFSYPRPHTREAKKATIEPYLQRFFDDLSDEVGEQLGLDPFIVGFLDEEGIDLGDEWEKKVADALQVSKTMVCTYSPTYFNRLYCGKEWKAFYDRCQQAVQQGNYASMPPLIKPVLWMPLLELPQVVAKLQYLLGNENSVVNTEGMRFVLKQIGNYNSEYVAYIGALARSITEDARRYPLPPMRGGLKPLAEIEPFFPPPRGGAGGAVPQPPAAPAPAAAGANPSPLLAMPRHIRFIIAAADPAMIGQGPRAVDPYREHGADEWKPFYSQDRREIGAIVQNVASGGDLGLTSDFAPFDATIRDAVERAREERKIVILIVDSWSVTSVEKWRAILEEFEDRAQAGAYFNCSVLVPWDENDLELKPRQAEIEAAVRGIFSRRASNSALFRDSIRSEEQLRSTLREVIILLLAEIRKRAAVRRPIPPGLAQPPTISGAGH